MNKSDIRKLYLQKRLDLSLDQYKLLNEILNEQFLTFLPDASETIHLYLPLINKKEPDTWPIIHALWNSGKNTVVPVMDPISISLTSWSLSPETIIKENPWGIPEPINGTIVEPDCIDLVVLPLLAYDRQGYRVGYGKGYYDRYLAGFRHPPIKAGLSFFEPLEEIADRNELDVPMDFCITPSGIISF